MGLGALLSSRRRGVRHIVVIAVVPSRLEKAMKMGVDAVTTSSEEEAANRLVELHEGRHLGLGSWSTLRHRYFALRAVTRSATAGSHTGSYPQGHCYDRLGSSA